ncbi:MAG: hypothetical protein U0793_09045 [Gemmataceae bacterium]
MVHDWNSSLPPLAVIRICHAQNAVRGGSVVNQEPQGSDDAIGTGKGKKRTRNTESRGAVVAIPSLGKDPKVIYSREHPDSILTREIRVITKIRSHAVAELK